MRIAFLGKGGSGKTTLSSLFALYLSSKKYRVGLLDVDVNSHTADVLGAAEVAQLSEVAETEKIQTFLAGSNPLIQTAEMLNTTPPGHGSGAWTLDDDNFVTKNYGTKFGATARVFTTGSYKPHNVGVACHHGTQTIAENLLSHAQLLQNDAIVIDSVAGNDSFGTSLYFQDALVWVVKPEREGVDVFGRYYDMAQRVGVADSVYVIGNQCTTDSQVAFLQREIPTNMLLGCLRTSDRIVDARLDDTPLSAAMISDEMATVFSRVITIAKAQQKPPQEYYDFIVRLHKKVVQEPWVYGAYRKGLEDQIDATYRPA